ncbi:hypothetical protein AMK21_09290 [Streptomyces sp. CB00316]|nr:hypothetical protein AMK21_09290 [Streptomyces sp. CB00316]
MSGLPKMAAMTAAAPAAPSSAVLCGVAGARTKCRKSRARPPPSAIRGASGPRTAPSGRLATAATGVSLFARVQEVGGREQQQEQRNRGAQGLDGTEPRARQRS